MPGKTLGELGTTWAKQFLLKGSPARESNVKILVSMVNKQTLTMA